MFILVFSSSSDNYWMLHFESSSFGSCVVSWPNRAIKLAMALKCAMLLAYLSMQVGWPRWQQDTGRYRSAIWTWHLASLTLSLTTICKREGCFFLGSKDVNLKVLKAHQEWCSAKGHLRQWLVNEHGGWITYGKKNELHFTLHWSWAA